MTSRFRTRRVAPLPAAWTQAPRAAEAAGPDVLFILDGSGSMWGRVEDRPKISVVTEVMADLVGTLPDVTRAGLEVTPDGSLSHAFTF